MQSELSPSIPAAPRDHLLAFFHPSLAGGSLVGLLAAKQRVRPLSGDTPFWRYASVLRCHPVSVAAQRSLGEDLGARVVKGRAVMRDLPRVMERDEVRVVGVSMILSKTILIVRWLLFALIEIRLTVNDKHPDLSIPPLPSTFCLFNPISPIHIPCLSPTSPPSPTPPVTSIPPVPPSECRGGAADLGPRG